MRSIAAAQWQFALTCGNMKYASTLPGAGDAGAVDRRGLPEPGPDRAPTPFEKSGYMFQMAAKPVESGVPACNGAVPADGLCRRPPTR